MQWNGIASHMQKDHGPFLIIIQPGTNYMTKKKKKKKTNNNKTMHIKHNKVKCNKMEYATAGLGPQPMNLGGGHNSAHNTIPPHSSRRQKCILDKLNQEDCRLGCIEGIIRTEALDL